MMNPVLEQNYYQHNQLQQLSISRDQTLRKLRFAVFERQSNPHIEENLETIRGFEKKLAEQRFEIRDLQK